VTFSVPKSVSLLYALDPPPGQLSTAR
jgi:hypothetical protein